jgi:4-amino-4-deoxy-L-arabinose transferase-like glycosyltransferase
VISDAREQRSGADAKKFLLPLVAAASLAAGWAVYVTRLQPNGAFAWDEATHALRGLLIARDLQDRDWLASFYDSYRQVYWPPLHAWLTGLAFLICGPSTIVARSVSLIAFVLLAPILFLTGRELESTNRDLAGAVTAALALTSPPIAALAATAMLECSALLAFSVTLFVYARLGRAGVSPPAHALLGLMVMLTYFLKSNYGILLLLALIVVRLLDAGFRVDRWRNPENGYAVAPVVVLSALWFAYPPKVFATLHALINQPWGGTDARGFAGVLFYPHALFRFSGSVWVFLLLLASLVATWKYRHDRNVRLLLVLAVCPFLIGSLHHTKLDRHLLTVLPPFFLLTGLATSSLWTRLVQWRRVRWVAASGLGVLLAFQAKAALGSPQAPPSERATQAIFDCLSGFLRRAQPALVIGTMDLHLGPPMIDWHLAVDDHLLDVTRAGSVGHIEEERHIARLVSLAPELHGLRDEILRVVGRYDEGTGTRSFYLGLPTDIDAARFGKWLRQTLDLTRFGGVAVITSLANEARYPPAFLAPSLQRAGLVQLSDRVFDADGLRVDLYARSDAR